MCDIRCLMRHRSSVCVRMRDECVATVKRDVQPFMAVSGPRVCCFHSFYQVLVVCGLAATHKPNASVNVSRDVITLQ